MSKGLYELDRKEQKVVVSLITSGFRQNGYRRVPVLQEDFVMGYTTHNIQDSINSVLTNKGISVECTPEDAFYLYDDLMR